MNKISSQQAPSSLVPKNKPDVEIVAPIKKTLNQRALIITCEHATNSIPTEYQHLFKSHQALLQTHRGIDIGAKVMADYLAQHLFCNYYHCATTSRLLIDCNRTLKNPHCFSEMTQSLSPQEKTAIIQQYYEPFRKPVIQQIEKLIRMKQPVLHLSIHSFTPSLNGQIRNADIGILYDPKRDFEKSFARQWKKQLSSVSPQYRVRMNYPYLGTSDGFTQYLRKKYPQAQYMGFELECNQALTSVSSSLNELNQLITSTLC